MRCGCLKLLLAFLYPYVRLQYAAVDGERPGPTQTGHPGITA